MVLTQRDPRRAAQLLGEAMFPYHYGSHATAGRPVIVLTPDEEFPYHYGSYATVRYEEVLAAVLTFPYHYGSYATQHDTSYAVSR